jgi:hypothetical protein
MNAQAVGIGTEGTAHWNNRHLPATVKGYGPHPYELVVLVSDRNGSTELTLHVENFEPDKS